MGYQLLDSTATVQVFSPQLVAGALLCTIQSFPSGAILIRSVPDAEFQADQGVGILSSLSDAVESILQEGIATAAQGTQGLDDAGLLFDGVIFTVTYVPPYVSPGTIEGTVTVPVNIITADTSLLGGSGAASAPELILAEYNRLKALAGG